VDEHAPTSDVEMPDVDEDDEDNKEKPKAETPKKKAAGKTKTKGKGKGKGGVMFPEEWPWEDAKKIFEKPDVLPADEVEVSS